MDGLLTAVLLGLSFGNLWLCALLVFSLQTTNRNTCAGYLVGRLLAIVVLAVVVSLLGSLVTVERSVLNVASGILLLGFGAYLAVTRLFHWVPPWRTAPSPALACDGHCQSCPAQGTPHFAAACRDCGDEGLCSAEEPEVEPLTRQARGFRGRVVAQQGSGGFAFGMAIGSLRGAALCAKLAVLIPILLTASVIRALGMGVAFGLSSSLYPLLGFVFGALALKLVRFKRHLFALSCLMLVVVGLRYLSHGLGSLT